MTNAVVGAPGYKARVSLIPRPSAASFLVAYVTFGSLSDKGSKVTHATKNETADSLGTRLG